MYNIENFTLKDMVVCSGVLRKLGTNAASMEEVAERMTRHFCDGFVKEDGDKAFALVRLFKTHRYDELDEGLRAFAQGILGSTPAFPEMKCLTLLGSAGTQPEWNSRKGSMGHKAIPLPSEGFVGKFPMIRQLVQQLGMEVNTVLNPDPKILMDLAQTTFNVFHIPEAIGSQYVPAQKEFVIPFGVRSVLGFGSILPSGNLFAVIMFCKVPVFQQTADMFKTLALSVKIALLPLDGKTFAQPESPSG